MKKLLMAATSIIFAATLTGCGVTSFNASNQVGTQSRVVFTDDNFRVVKNVEGYSKATYICGIGGLSKKSARENAIADMYKRANLSGSQTIANVYVKSHTSTVLGFYTRVIYSASGQVVQFLPEK